VSERLREARQLPATKLICTLGPAASTLERVEALAAAGASVFRINLSHGTRADHERAADLVRMVEARVGRTLGLLADLPGPKVRLGTVSPEPLQLAAGQRFELRLDGSAGDPSGASVTHPGLGNDVERGDRILLADGAVELVVQEAGDPIVTECVREGEIRSRAGVNVPSDRLGLPAVTDRDREGLALGLELGVDLVAQSFVRRAADVRALRELMGDRAVPVVAKVETRMAVDDAEAIIAAADGLMVARGDLGVELPMEDIPILQKELLYQARAAGRPSIVATQMLESMQHAPRPTRAEANDVANAVLDGADAVMLSSETAIGEYPVEAAAAAIRIADVAERRGDRFREAAPPCRHDDGPSAIAHAAAQVAARHPEATAIACFTRSGRTAELLSTERPQVSIHVFATVDEVRRALALRWGVWPMAAQVPADTDAMIAAMEAGLVAAGRVREGDVVVMVASSPVGAARTNLLKNHRIGGPGQ
jgi:pyruvate kinase